ncbi:putative leader peptide [Catenulispora acidiphila]|nr:putative leader peptide [Catenulispora acidiphila]
MRAMYSQLRVLRRHVDLLRVSSALCPGASQAV